MTHILKKNTGLLCCLVLLVMASCSSRPKSRVYAFKNAYAGTSKKAARSGVRIDNEITHEVHFKLEKPADCITVVLKCTTVPDGFADKKRVLKSFFILEKFVDISRYRQGARTMYSEIGRNYAAGWKSKKGVKFCSQPGDPIKKLDASFYRVRFTTFTKEEFDFALTVKSDMKAEFKDRAP